MTFTHFSSYYFAIQRATVLPLHYADELKVGKHVFRRNSLSVLLLEIQDTKKKIASQPREIFLTPWDIEVLYQYKILSEHCQLYKGPNNV